MMEYRHDLFGGGGGEVRGHMRSSLCIIATAPSKSIMCWLRLCWIIVNAPLTKASCSFINFTV